MHRIHTVIVGGGQAGLAMSRCLSDRSVDHLILERGQVAERWRSERWDSLRLLTPNWQTRLPGFRYAGADPDGYMSMPQLVAFLERYAASFAAPVQDGATVLAVEKPDAHFRVRTNRGAWRADNVVVATGYNDRPHVPRLARSLSPRVVQVVPTQYHNPNQLPPGGVLVVGASASGVQLADENNDTGRPVALAVGRHLRLPRRYRGRDILWWLDAMGVFNETTEDVFDLHRARHQPSLQLTGRTDVPSLDVVRLAQRGVRVLGRLVAADGERLFFDDDLIATTAASDLKLAEILQRIDAFIANTSSTEVRVPPEPFEPTWPLALEVTKTIVDLRAAMRHPRRPSRTAEGDMTDVDTLRSSYDAVIVGGRCAGAATALMLARGGMTVLLVERGARGADTLSTLALMRGGVLQLARWGLLDAIRAAGTPRIDLTTFHYGQRAVEIRIKPRDGVDALYAPRRTLLDPLLADAARASGGEVAYRVRLSGLEHDARGRVTGAVLESGGRARSIAAGIVVGADGADSTVAKRTGAETYWVGANASATIYTRVRGLRMSGYHWHYVPGASVGLIPTNDGETLVFASAAGRRFMEELRFDLAAGLDTIVREAAPLLASAISAAPVAQYRGFAGRRGFIRRAWGPGWALVGDAGYFKDPITAHGITDALRDAEGLARAVLSGTDAALASYQAIRDALSMRLFAITDEIASFDWDLRRLQTLHKALSEEMARDVSHVIERGIAGAAFGDVEGGTFPPGQPDHERLQAR